MTFLGLMLVIGGTTVVVVVGIVAYRNRDLLMRMINQYLKREAP